MTKYGAFVLRGQPFHVSHLETVCFGLKHVDRMLLVLGSHNQAQTVKNPWTTDQRIEMIRRSLLPLGLNHRVDFVPVRDFLYNGMLWEAAVQDEVAKVTGSSRDVRLLGHRKDASSAYLRSFPQWGEYLETGAWSTTGATQVRELLFRGEFDEARRLVPTGTWSVIEEWLRTSEHERLNEEYWAIEADKAAWASSPYQPTFVTTDAVVLCSGHVLVVRRRGKYGRGLIALPGGYIKADESLLDSCVRELKEETSIRMQANDIKACLTERDVFDDPGRDLRGRVITHGFRFVLPSGALPRVKGTDDADKAWWMSYSDALASEPRFFSDHYHIINRFISRS